MPICPGQDFVGRIVFVGEKIKKYNSFKIGDRVCSLHQFLGGNSKYVTLTANQLVKVPDNVDAAEAACVVRSYLAAYQILYRTGSFEVDKTHKILVTGANGYIGRAVIELAKMARAKVYAASNSRHRNFIRHTLGVTWVHADPKHWTRVQDLDAVIDCVNYTGNYNDSKAQLRRGGVLICAGSSKYVSDVIRTQRKKIQQIDCEYDSEEEAPGSDSMCGACSTVTKKDEVYNSNMLSHLPLKYGGGLQISIFVKQVSFDLFSNTESYWNGCKDDLLYLFAMLARGKIKPIIAHRIILGHVPKAHKLLEAGGLQGTIVCVIDKET